MILSQSWGPIGPPVLRLQFSHHHAPPLVWMVVLAHPSLIVAIDLQAVDLRCELAASNRGRKLDRRK